MKRADDICIKINDNVYDITLMYGIFNYVSHTNEKHTIGMNVLRTRLC